MARLQGRGLLWHVLVIELDTLKNDIREGCFIGYCIFHIVRLAALPGLADLRFVAV